MLPQNHSGHHPRMKLSKDGEKLGKTSKFLQHLLSVSNAFESSKKAMNRFLCCFSVCLPGLTCNKDHIDCRSFLSETALGFWCDPFGNCKCESNEHDLGKDLSSNGQQGNTPAVGADGFVSFVFIEAHCVGIFPLLGDTLSVQHFQNVKVKCPHAEVASFLDLMDFSWDVIRFQDFIVFEGIIYQTLVCDPSLHSIMVRLVHRH